MKILVIDLETTGFLSSNPDRCGKIVEIGIVRLNLKNGKKKILFDRVINPGMTKAQLSNSWICKNGYMNPDDILKGSSFLSITEELQEIIYKYKNGATAFNRKFDVDFLSHYGIKFPKLLPCPMIVSTPICKLPKANSRYGGYKWPKVEEAYKYFFPESEYVELHRGADDAFHEADIVYALHKLNKFI